MCHMAAKLPPALRPSFSDGEITHFLLPYRWGISGGGGSLSASTGCLWRTFPSVLHSWSWLLTEGKVWVVSLLAEHFSLFFYLIFERILTFLRVNQAGWQLHLSFYTLTGKLILLWEVLRISWCSDGIIGERMRWSAGFLFWFGLISLTVGENSLERCPHFCPTWGKKTWCSLLCFLFRLVWYVCNNCQLHWDVFTSRVRPPQAWQRIRTTQNSDPANTAFCSCWCVPLERSGTGAVIQLSRWGTFDPIECK